MVNRIKTVTKLLKSLGPDHLENMMRITNACGELLNASTALYNRIDDGLLCSIGRWNSPPDMPVSDKPTGHICFDVITRAVDDVYIVENLQDTLYLHSDPNVAEYKLKTYIGQLVRRNNRPVGSLCAVFQNAFKPGDIDLTIIEMLAFALSREESLQELEKSNSRYQELFNFSVGGLLTGSSEGIITDANLRFCQMTGYGHQELLGKFIGDILFTSKSLLEKPLRFDLLDVGNVVVVEREIIRSDGSIIPVEMHSKKMPDGSYLSEYYDITLRKLAEKSRMESDERVKLILSTIPVVLFTSTANSDIDIDFITGRVIQITGFSEQEFLDKPDLWRNHIHPDDLDRVLAAYKNPDINNEILVEYRWLTAEGNYKWFMEKAYLKIGRKSEFMGMLMDITERKRVYEELKGQNEQLKKLNLEKDNFFSILAHDLRSPFNGFLGLTYLLTEELKQLTREEIGEIAVTMRKSATNMYSMLENLLEWSRLQRGVLAFNPEVCNLFDTLLKSIDPLITRAAEKKIELIPNISDDLDILADQYMMESILRNIISNGIKFTNRGGMITIHSLPGPAGFVTVKVVDTGIGIDPEIKDKLFDISHLVKRSGTEGESGSGLGLILSREFVHKHGGSISVESIANVGTSVSFTIPKAVSE